MKLILFKKDYRTIFNKKIYIGFDYIIFKTRYFSFSWFTDCEEWFIFITIYKRTVRFSSAGFMYIKNDD